MSGFDWSSPEAAALFHPPTKEQREIYEAQRERNAAVLAAGEARAQISDLVGLFKMGWHKDEMQWRLTQEQVIEAVPWLKEQLKE